MDLMLMDDDWLVGWLDDEFERLEYFIADALGILCLQKNCITWWFGSSAMWQLFLDRCNASPASPAVVDAEVPGVLESSRFFPIKWPTLGLVISQKQISSWV